MVSKVEKIPRSDREHGEQGGSHVNGILHTVRLVSNTVAVIPANRFDFALKRSKGCM